MKIFLMAIFAVSISISNAQKLQLTSTNDLVLECMKSKEDGLNKQIAIWFPYNFWEIIGEQMKASPAFVENIVTQMQGYMMFCVVDYTTTSKGIFFKTDDDIRKSIILTDASFKKFTPINNNELPTEAKKLLQTLQPIMAQMLGQFGEGMSIYLFKINVVNGQPIFNITTKNNFSLSWNTTTLNWRLPFAAVMPPKYCSIDNEKMQGNWQYCPIHGVKLQ